MIEVASVLPVERFSAVVLGDDAVSVADALHAVALADGHVTARATRAEADAALGRVAVCDLILVELGGMADGAAAELLERGIAAAADDDHELLVCFDPAQIDLAAGAMAGRVQLLCAPDVGERVAALVLAGERARHSVLHDVNRTGEDRYAQLNAEVARIAEVLARLSRPEDAGRAARPQVADPRRDYDAPRESDVGPAEVRGAIRARRLRDQFLGEGLFEDPAWDMLLDLYAAHLERAQVSVSSLCIAAAVAPTTALRWIAKLTDAGLFERHPDPFDRRRAFLALSGTALDGMHRYVSAIHRAGLAIA